MLSRSHQLIEKSKAALISAIEIYNKPDFAYREETFSILMLNSWELLFKAKLLLDSNNNSRSIYVYENRRNKSGKLSKKSYIKRNRAGNPHTMGLSQLISELDKNKATRLPQSVKANLYAITEIRDNAVHFMNPGPKLSKRVLEIGTASLSNFVDLAQRWFSEDLSDFNLYLMPIGFIQVPAASKGLLLSEDEKKLLNYLEGLISKGADEASQGYQVALEVNISMKRSSSDSKLAVKVTDDPNAISVKLTEEDFKNKYPWDYEKLTKQVKKRYKDFKINSKYHSIRKPLLSDPRYVMTRLLDPGNPKSSKKDFYNPNILRIFDENYTQK